jgi:hypothetical protein
MRIGPKDRFLAMIPVGSLLGALNRTGRQDRLPLQSDLPQILDLFSRSAFLVLVAAVLLTV